MSGNKIIVPSYQRAYSWDTPIKSTDKNTQIDVFLSDLEEYRKSDSKSPYYFGHFLFEEKDQKFCVIDGQQRLTTIVIFLAALFNRLRSIRELSEEEQFCEEDMVRRDGIRRFSTVDYDNQLFVDYVIEQTKTDHHGLYTESARRIVRAFDFFKVQLSSQAEGYLTRMLSIISQSTCSTHPVQNESEAIQMFIFQNNRGKRPSNLEIVKAQFMYNVHLYGNDDRDSLINEIKSRFEKIYKSIASIEYRITEDDVLLYTLRVYFNSLLEDNALEKIDKKLSERKDSINFIKTFTQSLEISFDHLFTFFCKDEQTSFEIHSLITLGGIAIAFPFIIKAYKYGLPIDDRRKLCASLESLVLRDRLIGTRADITSRINDVFREFTEDSKDIQSIVDRVEFMKKTTDFWWAHWNEQKLNESLQDGLNHRLAKHLLWKYENYLKNPEPRHRGYYLNMRFEEIERPELEHIAPTTEPSKKPHGYDNYDEVFRNQYLNCLGNYLLLSGSHNESIQNDPFPIKHADYRYLEQQKEVQNMVDPSKGIWSRELIKTRKEKIIRFITDNC